MGARRRADGRAAARLDGRRRVVPLSRRRVQRRLAFRRARLAGLRQDRVAARRLLVLRLRRRPRRAAARRESRRARAPRRAQPGRQRRHAVRGGTACASALGRLARRVRPAGGVGFARASQARGVARCAGRSASAQFLREPGGRGGPAATQQPAPDTRARRDPGARMGRGARRRPRLLACRPAPQAAVPHRVPDGGSLCAVGGDRCARAVGDGRGVRDRAVGGGQRGR